MLRCVAMKCRVINDAEVSLMRSVSSDKCRALNCRQEEVVGLNAGL